MDSEIDFGVILSTYGEHSDPAGFERIARTAENNDFDVVSVSDHIALPAIIPDTYPFSPSGEFPFDSSDDLYELFSVLSMLAGITDDVTLMSNVCIVPYRHPVLLTKQALTLDALSDGRFELGVATGWLETEFEVLDVPFDERGSRTDEFLELLERVCEEGELAFDGPHHSIQETGFYPIPDPGDEIPVWVGGHSSAAFRRVAEYGRGWTIVWSRPDDIQSARARIMNAWDIYDRQGEPEITLMRAFQLGTGDSVDDDRLLVGDPDAVISDIEAYVDAGVTRLMLDFYTPDTDEQCRQLQQFGDEVIPSF